MNRLFLGTALGALVFGAATQSLAQDISSNSGSNSTANSGSISGAQNETNNAANNNIGSSESNSTSGSAAISGSASESTSSGNIQGQGQDQGQGQMQGQEANNAQGQMQGQEANNAQGQMQGQEANNAQGQMQGQEANNAQGQMQGQEANNAQGQEQGQGQSQGQNANNAQDQGQSQGQSANNSQGQEANNSQGQMQSQGQAADQKNAQNTSITFNNTQRKTTEVRTNNAVPLAASSSFSSDYCGGTVSGGASASPIGISIGGAAPKFDKVCQSLRRAEKFGMAAANAHNMQQPEMASRLMSMMIWSICTSDDGGKPDSSVNTACSILGLTGGSEPSQPQQQPSWSPDPQLSANGRVTPEAATRALTDNSENSQLAQARPPAQVFLPQ